ncbi:hypothetical protein QTG56_09645 [Rossellomorea sp. AcN35-11]|nr:hypothetical protein [Rossellomorea aquimaris]NMH68516.1 hypothetical protein [Bacillus sp. RO3]WJV31193.1 hypothetical protein QTG56_09645 [Rossellomorea sp. AcN35-11]
MKKKTIAVTTIFVTFFGFAWLIESQDRFNRGLIEVEDPTSINIRPVQYGETEEMEEGVMRDPVRQRLPYGSREYIRVVPHASPRQ